MGVYLLAAELLFLFFSSQFIFKSLFSLFHVILRSRRISMGLISLIFFPGVFIHELAHYIMARVLFVKAVSFNMIPHFEENHIRLGNVEIVKTDFIRRLLIGLAPILVGICALVGLLWWGSTYVNVAHLNWTTLLQILILLYGVFVISNTMFSSKKDVEGMWLLVFIGIVAVGGAAVLGANVLGLILSVFEQKTIQEYNKQLGMLLLVPTGINVILMVVFRLLRRGY